MPFSLAMTPQPSPAKGTHTAAGRDGDLDGVAARLAHVLQVEGLVGGLVVTALDGEWGGVDADLHRGRPVGVHLPVLVVVALELQLQVRPARGGWMLRARGRCEGLRAGGGHPLTSASGSCRRSHGAGRRDCSRPGCAAGGRAPGPPHPARGRSAAARHKGRRLEAGHAGVSSLPSPHRGDRSPSSPSMGLGLGQHLPWDPGLGLHLQQILVSRHSVLQ